MVPFFGILNPGFGRRVERDDAPLKAQFFSRSNESDATLSRAEQDALFLTGRLSEPAARDDGDLLRFLQQAPLFGL